MGKGWMTDRIWNNNFILCQLIQKMLGTVIKLPAIAACILKVKSRLWFVFFLPSLCSGYGQVSVIEGRLAYN